MTMRTCLAKIIPALWLSLLALAAFTASSSPQTKRAPARTPAATATIAAPLPTTLAAMVRAYRETPTAPRRAAIEAYGAAHPQEAPLARLALGVASIEAKDYPL